MYIDLDEIDEFTSVSSIISKEKLNLITYRRTDYHRPEILNLKDAVYATVKEKSGLILSGPVRMLTHLRYFGYCMNPVTFYYCFDQEGQNLMAVMAEIENTPWGERYQYIHPINNEHNYEFSKTFHVSPFFPMDMNYQWKLSDPKEMLTISMNSFQNGNRQFNASLSLKSLELNPASLNKTIFKFPFMTFKVICGIYLQAARLWLKKVPFYSHPNSSSQRNFLIFKGDK